MFIILTSKYARIPYATFFKYKLCYWFFTFTLILIYFTKELDSLIPVVTVNAIKITFAILIRTHLIKDHCR